MKLCRSVEMDVSGRACRRSSTVCTGQSQNISGISSGCLEVPASYMRRICDLDASHLKNITKL